MGKQPVEHFSDSKEAWNNELFGLTRYSGIFASGLLTVAFTALTTTGAPWWSSFLPVKSIELKHIVITSMFLLGLLFTLGLWYLRRRSMRSLNVKYLLHQLAHFARDTQVLLAKASSEIRLKDVTSDYAGKIKEYFEELLPNTDIQVAIRLIETTDGKTCYKTIIRTSGLNTGRENYTEPLAADEGIARFLQSESACRGVLIYHDLKKAAKVQAYQLTKNDEKVPR